MNRLEQLVSRADGSFLDLEAQFSNPAESKIWILPVPFDGTSTWQKGAERGPAALLEASRHMELYDIESHCEVHRLGIATLPQLDCSGDTDPEELAEELRELVTGMLASGRFPVLLGGDHSISIGAIRAAQQSCEDLTIVQLDAHADTRESYCGSPFNHGCVMARAREGGPVIQVGIRSLDLSELAALDKSRVHPAHRIHRDKDWLAGIKTQLSSRTWLTLDLDCLDPSLMPSTGTPEPGGLTWQQLMDLIRLLARESQIVGMDLVELKPVPGHLAPDYLAARLLHRILSEVWAAHPLLRLSKADRIS